MTGGRRALGVLVVGLALAVSDVAGAAPRLVEAPACARPSGAAVDAAGPGETAVTFGVAARTRLRVARGHVVAASTNTGCAPRGTDQFLTGNRPATPGEVRAALAAFRTGDWRSPGTWHPAR